MKKLLLLIILNVSVSLAYSQKDTVITISNDSAHHIEVEARVDAAQWRHHLENSLQNIVDKAALKGMPVGKYTVNVRFLIEKDGSIADVKAINDLGYGITPAIERVVRTGPHWIPGSIDGRVVRSYHTQPITFQITK